MPRWNNSLLWLTFSIAQILILLSVTGESLDVVGLDRLDHVENTRRFEQDQLLREDLAKKLGEGEEEVVGEEVQARKPLFKSNKRSSQPVPTANYRRAKIISCATCKLDTHPEVKDFIFEDFEKYIGTDFLKVPGKAPTLYYFGLNGKVVEQFDITEKTRKELNTMMEVRGFKIKGARFSEL